MVAPQFARVRVAQRHVLRYGVNRSRFFQRGSFLGEWWDPWEILRNVRKWCGCLTELERA